MNLVMTTDGDPPPEAKSGTLPGPRPGELEALFRAQYGPMVRLAHLLLGSNALAEEVVQDVFARWHERGSWADVPAAYLRVSVVNACRSQQRSAGRSRTRELRVARRDEAATAQPRELFDVIDALPERMRAVIVLRYYEDLDDATIARLLDCRPATVRSLAHRAINELRTVVTR